LIIWLKKIQQPAIENLLSIFGHGVQQSFLSVAFPTILMKK
jgi:hypothetical protein